MTRKKRNYRLSAMLLSLALIAVMIAACGKDDASNNNKESVLRIATSGFGPNAEWLRGEFTDIFEFANPNITIEIVAVDDQRYYYNSPRPGEEPVNPVDQLKEMMDGTNPPDIVMTDYEQLSELILENRLVPLDPLMTRDKIDANEFVPSVIDGLRSLSTDGNLYALAPLFSSSALIYNEKIFNDAGVPYPTDEMTWDEMFDLGRQVASGEGDDRISGFSFNQYQYSDMFNDMNIYTAPLGLNMFDEAGETMTVDTDQWEKVWQTMLGLKTEKILPEPPDYSKPYDENKPQLPFEHDSLLSGRVAMAIVHYSYLNEVINVNKNAANIEGFDGVNWNVVTVPMHSENPGVGGYVNMNGIMAINAKAQNSEDAWKLISFINGKKWAEVKSRSAWDLVSRKEFIKPKDGLDYNIAAFYTLAPAPNPFNDAIYREQNMWQIRNIGQMKFEEVVKGTKEVREALKEWQTEGDLMLQQIKENPGVDINTMMEQQNLKEASGG